MDESLQPLDAEQHRTHGFKVKTGYDFAAGDMLAPVLLAELSSVMPHYALVFRKPAETGRYQLNVLLGFKPGGNLFVDARGQWLADCYVPSVYRSYPFVMKTVRVDGGFRGLVCFDRRSGLYRERPDPQQREVRFFDDDGHLQPGMKKLVTLLEKTTRNREVTQAAVDALAEAQLLVPWELRAVRGGESPETVIQGLYRIDEAALNNLEADALLDLQRANALAAAYAQLLSMARIRPLRQKYAAARPPAEQQKKMQEPLHDDRGDAGGFSLDDDDMITGS